MNRNRHGQGQEKGHRQTGRGHRRTGTQTDRERAQTDRDTDGHGQEQGHRWTEAGKGTQTDTDIDYLNGQLTKK
jgi:hypothetical protein